MGRSASSAPSYPAKLGKTHAMCCSVLMFNYSVESWWISKCNYWQGKCCGVLCLVFFLFFFLICVPVAEKSRYHGKRASRCQCCRETRSSWLSSPGSGSGCTGVHALLIQDSRKGPVRRCRCSAGHVPAPSCLSSLDSRGLLRKKCCSLQIDLSSPIWSWNLLKYCCGTWSWLKLAWGWILYRGSCPQFLGGVGRWCCCFCLLSCLIFASVAIFTLEAVRFKMG